jgi:hypothetical protein
VNREHSQVSSNRIFAIDLLQSGFGDIMLKYLPDAILCIRLIPPFSRMEQVCFGLSDLIITLGDHPSLLEHALYFIG